MAMGGVGPQQPQNAARWLDGLLKTARDSVLADIQTAMMQNFERDLADTITSMFPQMSDAFSAPHPTNVELVAGGFRKDVIQALIDVTNPNAVLSLDSQVKILGRIEDGVKDFTAQFEKAVETESPDLASSAEARITQEIVEKCRALLNA